MTEPFPRPGSFRTAQAFRAHVAALGVELPFALDLIPAASNPIAQPYRLANGRTIGNRFCALPMEGWDGTLEGQPSEVTVRRWRNFGRSGAKLIWGGEAVAVRHDGRANPNQLIINKQNARSLERLRRALVDEHNAYHSSTADLLIGLQLTHSGRFSRPNRNDQLEPVIAYHHPVLDPIVGVGPDHTPISDEALDVLVEDFIEAARLAEAIGFDFVDVKHCHGYLGHELLSGYSRPGRYGGSLENRTRFLRQVVEGIRGECRHLEIGVRLSAFDFPPFVLGSGAANANPTEYRDSNGRYPFAFGADPDQPLHPRLDEALEFVEILEGLQIVLLCVTAGSPYYCYHVQRPAGYPSLGAYPPPEDPLVGVARQIAATAEIKRRFPAMAIVGSAYTYLQEWLPHVAQCVVGSGMADFVGLGRMMLSYPEFAADVLEGKTPDRKRICRTFSDCTSAPRKGLVSGCFPLDPYYGEHPDAERLKTEKEKAKEARSASQARR